MSWRPNNLGKLFKDLISARAVHHGAIFLLKEEFRLLEEDADDALLQQAMAHLSTMLQSCSESGSIILKILIMSPSRHSQAMAAADSEDVLRIKPGKKKVGGTLDQMHINHVLAAALENAHGYPMSDSAV